MGLKTDVGGKCLACYNTKLEFKIKFNILMSLLLLITMFW